MVPYLNLASLPPDIIRGVVRAGDDWLKEIRLISPAWDSLVHDYLARRQLGTLERVYLFAGVFGDEKEEDEMEIGPHLATETMEMENVEQKMRMVAIIPELHSNNVGVGKWLTEHKRYIGNAIEVTSAPQRCEGSSSNHVTEEKPVEVEPPSIVKTTRSSGGAVLDVLTVMAISSLSIAFIVAFNAMGLNLLGILIVIFVIYSICNRHDKAEKVEVENCDQDALSGCDDMLMGGGGLAEMLKGLKSKAKKKKNTSKTQKNKGLAGLFDLSRNINPNKDLTEDLGLEAMLSGLAIPNLPLLETSEDRSNFPRLARFLSMFARIETLVLEESCLIGGEDGDFFGAVQKALGGIKVDRLDVIERSVGQILQKGIIDICRKNSIRQVFISTTSFSMSRFRDFALQLTQLGVTVDLYERDGGRDIMYLGKPQFYWDKLITDLAAHQCSLRMTTKHDQTFDRQAYEYRVKTHIRIERDGSLISPLIPMEHPRGFDYESRYN